jgi:hypothetical protein
VHQHEHRRERIFREQLLPPNDDDQETDGVAQRREQIPRRARRQLRVQFPLPHHRKSDRQACGER